MRDNTTKQSVFSDYPICDCNRCERYYDSQCDGTKVGEQRECKGYIATRHTDIEKRLREMEADVYNSKLLSGMVLVLLVLHISLEIFF